MKKRLLLSTLILSTILSYGQSEKKQEFGINMAGLIVKNQATVVPSLMYRYKIKKYQLRLQFAMDAKLDSKDRKGTFNSGGSFSNFNLDTSLKFEPGKDIKYGLIAGIQKNYTFDNSPFSYFAGIDLIYLMNEFSESAKGMVLQGNGSFDTTKQRISLKVSDKNKLQTFGVGIPFGITYKFGKSFYASAEARFLIAYQKGKNYTLTETSQIQQFQEFNSKVEGDTKFEGFDVGIKPLTGICLGVIF